MVVGRLDSQRREQLWQTVTARLALSDAGWAGAVCAVAAELLDAGMAITLRTDTRTEELVAASGTWAAGLEETQYTVGEGPGVDAFTTGGPVLVADLADNVGRWPMFTDTARAEGVTAVFAFPMQVGAIRLGTVDIYRRTAGFLTTAALGDAAILVDLATMMVLRRGVTAVVDDDPLPDDEPAGGSYQDVHVATGMLAVQLRIGLQDASARLRAHAFSTGRPLLEVSRDVLAQRIPLDRWTD